VVIVPVDQQNLIARIVPNEATQAVDRRHPAEANTNHNNPFDRLSRQPRQQLLVTNFAPKSPHLSGEEGSRPYNRGARDDRR
jgi:hypothetical protein